VSEPVSGRSSGRSDTSSRALSLDSLREALAAWRAKDVRVVLVSGAFDLPQAGHARRVREARRRGDRLVVAVEADALAARTLGPGRPSSKAADRARVMAALRGVDAVTIVTEVELERLVSELGESGGAADSDALDRERWLALRASSR